MTRTDIMWDAFLTEVLNAWSGPCQNDGNCVEDASCAFADPDCDPCGMDGVCAAGCALPDRDCELGGLAADPCTGAMDCESRICVSAPEDERIQYCSMPCDPSKTSAESECFAPLTICEEQADGTGVCAFPGLTPGVQGARCEGSEDCRSGMCDQEEGICVEACGDNLPVCAEGYECLAAGDTKVCAIPSKAGCEAASSKATWSGVLLMLALFIVSRKRSQSLRSR